jgi:hypothetical protein
MRRGHTACGHAVAYRSVPGGFAIRTAYFLPQPAGSRRGAGQSDDDPVLWRGDEILSGAEAT